MTEKIYAEITTSLSAQAIEEKLNSRLNETPSILSVFSNGPTLKGSVQNGILKANDFSAPPIQISGVIKEDERGTVLSINLVAHSMKKGLSGLAMALLYPIVFVVFLLSVINNPLNFWAYFFVLFSIPIIYLMSKIYVFFNYQEPDPKVLLKQLAKFLNGKVQRF